MLMLFCVALTHPGTMRRCKSHRCRRFINVSVGCKEVWGEKKAKEGKKKENPSLAVEFVFKLFWGF